MMYTNYSLIYPSFRDPGKPQKELFGVPGFINELKRHTLAVAPRPNEPLAFAGALAMLTHLTGRSYVSERGLHTNLYIVALAPSGMGKEEPRITNQHLANEAGIIDSVPDSVASGEGLEDAMMRRPSLLMQTDEADSLFSAMRKDDSRAARLSEMVLRFFSDSKGVHIVRLKAGDRQTSAIKLPHLTLFATGVPTFVYDALNLKALENGLLGRCLFVENDEFCPLGDPVNEPLPQACVEAAKFMAEKERRFVETGVLDPIIVHENEEAKEKLAELRLRADEISQQLFDAGLTTAAVLYCRIYEKAMKLAMLWAISENPIQPVMSVDAVNWGAMFVVHSTNRILYASSANISENTFDRLKNRFIKLLRKAGGQLDRTTLLRSLHIDATTFAKIVKTLHLCDLIEEEMIDRRKTLYTLKTEN